jgi:hypothetical protein
VPEGDNGHWKVIDGVIDYDACSEAPGKDKNLWTAKEYGDFTLKIDWRLKQTTGLYDMPVVLPDGTHKLDENGKEIKIPTPNADSGIYLRGVGKSQINIWCWPIGSGEVYGYRMDKTMPPEVRAGVTPKVKADKPVGEWNTFEITMKGDRLTVVLNGQTGDRKRPASRRSPPNAFSWGLAPVRCRIACSARSRRRPSAISIRSTSPSWTRPARCCGRYSRRRTPSPFR